ncbi:acyltransferase family protein [Litoreibacter arenae]|uniref:Acyltransferase 3 domain-containing protein n=1 Tax=Litoreibacter arenae DSM 19593 TaxID=1123360 RepID=S9RY50_9RHOB|nr:acyltransferase [Litoreibacter arenae]EPX78919.1 hypothetical protein thalar_01734 [Litoreibacter arenae DSM 19593]
MNGVLRRYGETDFITGLRAIAALMVVMIHTGAWRDFGDIGHSISDAGKYGVDMFFVISGFTIAKTFQDAPTYHAYLTQRMWRILPLYYLAITATLGLWASGLFGTPPHLTALGAEASFYNWAIHMSLLSYLDYTHANSILGVEWSIPIEVFWYLSLPFVLIWANTSRRVWLILGISLITKALLAYVTKKAFGTSLPNAWLPTSYGHLFLLGALSFRWRERFSNLILAKAQGVIVGAVILFILGLSTTIPLRGEIIALSTLMLLSLQTPSRGRTLNVMLTARPVLYLGSISYSIYLFHPVIIYISEQLGFSTNMSWLNFIMVTSATAAFSTMTYLYIERPTNLIGKQMVPNRPAL